VNYLEKALGFGLEPWPQNSFFWIGFGFGGSGYDAFYFYFTITGAIAYGGLANGAIAYGGCIA